MWSNPRDSAKKIALKRTLQVHILLLLLFSLSSSPSLLIKPRQKMRVQTTYLQPKKGSVAKQKALVKSPQKLPLKAQLETKQKTATKQEANLNKQPIKTPPTKQQSKTRLEEIEKNLKKIENSIQAPSKELFVAVEASFEVKEALPYESLVVQLLQKSLKLIDQESVDVHIFVQPTGIVDKTIKIYSESALNARIVEATLEKMVFPSFESFEPIELHLHLCTGN